MLRWIEDRLIGNMTDYERSVLRHGAAWFFLVLLSYYILRPIREQIGATYGVANLSGLFAATFIVMLFAIPIFSWLVGRFDRVRLVPIIYAICIVSLLAFWLAMETLPQEFQLWVACTFFVWVSVFGLFVVSFFWSVVGDMLNSDQGRRIFGVIMGGGTIGGMVGSQIAIRLTQAVGVARLLIVPVVALSLALVVYTSMEFWHRKLSPGLTIAADGTAVDGKATGGNPFAGFTAVFRSKYLLAICGFGLLLATCSTGVYFQQSEIVNQAYAGAPFDLNQVEPLAKQMAETRVATTQNKTANQDPSAVNDDDRMKATEQLQLEASKSARTVYFANIDFAVSILTLSFQFFLAGWLMRHVGVGWSLAMLPLAYVLGIVALGMSPTLSVLAVVATIGRAAEYGINNPAREVLFTAVDREDRYKAKSFIDTVVRRGGDSGVGYAYKQLRESFGLGLTTLSWVLIPFAVAWVGLALFIGNENKKRVDQKDGLRL